MQTFKKIHGKKLHAFIFAMYRIVPFSERVARALHKNNIKNESKQSIHFVFKIQVSNMCVLKAEPVQTFYTKSKEVYTH